MVHVHPHVRLCIIIYIKARKNVVSSLSSSTFFIIIIIIYHLLWTSKLNTAKCEGIRFDTGIKVKQDQSRTKSLKLKSFNKHQISVKTNGVTLIWPHFVSHDGPRLPSLNGLIQSTLKFGLNGRIKAPHTFGYTTDNRTSSPERRASLEKMRQRAACRRWQI